FHKRPRPFPKRRGRDAERREAERSHGDRGNEGQRGPRSNTHPGIDPAPAPRYIRPAIHRADRGRTRMPYAHGAGTPLLFSEVSQRLPKQLTGIGRFTARLLEALARQADLRLVSCVPAEAAVGAGLSTALLCGEEMAVPRGSLPTSDTDLDGWVRRL